jgi:HlyD family secretion protein
MQVEAHISEADVSKLTAGMPVSFTVDAYSGRKFEGRLRQVRNAATTVQNVVTYDAIVDVDNPELALRPGMTATVTFTVADKADVLRIPNAALRFRPARPASAQARPAGARPQGQARSPDSRMVFTVEGGQLNPVPVRIGVTDGSNTELVEGAVSEGMALVTDSGDAAPARPAASPMGGPAGMPPGLGGGRGRGGR